MRYSKDLAIPGVSNLASVSCHSETKTNEGSLLFTLQRKLCCNMHYHVRPARLEVVKRVCQVQTRCVELTPTVLSIVMES